MSNSAFTISANGGTVTSVGASVGTSGSDFNITGSPITGAGSFIFNLPTASASVRGLLSSADWSAFHAKFDLPALTSTGVVFSNGTTLVTDATYFNYNATYHTMGIGTTASTTEALTAAQDTSSNGKVLVVKNTGTPNDYFSMGTAAGSNTIFIPAFIMKTDTSGYGGSGVYGAIFANQVNDTAYNTAPNAGAAISYDARNYANNAALSNRNLFAWGSFGLVKMLMDAGGRLGLLLGASTQPTAKLHIGPSSTSANSAPIKLDNTGALMTATEAGAIENVGDQLFFTINTGTARKRLLKADPVGGLTSGRVPYATTNGRLTDDSKFTQDGTALGAQHFKGNTAAPTIAAGTGAGTGPTVSISNGSDVAGIVNVTTGTTPTAGGIAATITFAAAYGVAPNVILQPRNANTALLTGVTQVYVTSTTTTFVITTGSTALTASTAYSWFYLVIQ